MNRSTDDDVATVRAIAQRWWTQGIATDDDDLMHRAMRLFESVSERVDA